MRRFWFAFERHDALPAGVRIGCGVTALDREDALGLLRSRVFGAATMPSPVSVIDDVEIASLDAGHVRPNMGNYAVRGIWFPLGYEHVRVA